MCGDGIEVSAIIVPETALEKVLRSNQNQCLRQQYDVT